MNYLARDFVGKTQNNNQIEMIKPLCVGRSVYITYYRGSLNETDWMRHRHSVLYEGFALLARLCIEAS